MAGGRHSEVGLVKLSVISGRELAHSGYQAKLYMPRVWANGSKFERGQRACWRIRRSGTRQRPSLTAAEIGATHFPYNTVAPFVNAARRLIKQDHYGAVVKHRMGLAGKGMAQDISVLQLGSISAL